MKFKALALAVTMMLTQTSFASSQEPTCPELSTIKSVGLQSARMTRLGWLGYTTQGFGTENSWTFFTFIIGQFETPEAALVQGNDDLVKLSNAAGPQNPGKNVNEWICYYTGSGADAFAITPPPTSHRSLSMVATKQ